MSETNRNPAAGNRWGRYCSIDLPAIAICVALTAAAWFFGASPLIARHENAAHRRADLAAQKRKSEELAVAVRSGRRKLTDLQAATAAMPVSLQAPQSVNRRLNELASFCTRMGLELKDVQPMALAGGRRYAQLPIVVSGTGRFQDCARFFHELHGQFSDSGIESFQMTAAPTDAPQATAFSARLIWYVAPEMARHARDGGETP